MSQRLCTIRFPDGQTAKVSAEAAQAALLYHTVTTDPVLSKHVAATVEQRFENLRDYIAAYQTAAKYAPAALLDELVRNHFGLKK